MAITLQNGQMGSVGGFGFLWGLSVKWGNKEGAEG